MSDTTANQTADRRSLRKAITVALGRYFVSIQIVVLAALLCAGYNFASIGNQRVAVPQCNDKPCVIRPQFNYPFVISDQQLGMVLQKLHPRFEQNPTKVNYIDHAVRLWGATAKFDDGAFTGHEMLEMLLNHEQFVKNWGAAVPPLLQTSRFGIEVTTQQGMATVSHTDHLVGTLAELGIPLSYPVTTSGRSGRFADLLTHAFRSFRLNQAEYEWTALAAALYATDGRVWTSREGERIDFSAIAQRLMRQDQPQGVCYGQHRNYTLTMLLRIDEQRSQAAVSTRILDDATRDAIRTYLLNMTKRHHDTQSAAGYWDGNWSDLAAEVPDPETDPLSRRILATGHALEWWAMAPADLHPPRETIVRAAQWLSTTIEGMNSEQIERNYTFLTHAGRALALWRGQLPAEFEESQRSLGLARVKPSANGS